MPEQPSTPAPVAPVNTQFVAPPSASAKKPGCGYTILIIIITVIMTIIAEVVIGAVLMGVAVKNFMKNAQTGFLSSPTAQTVGSGNQTAGGKVVFTADQKKLIESLGVNPNDIPADFPMEKVACVENAIGKDRLDQFMKGTAKPSLMDIFRARGCITN